jgi:hypothetical protein
VELSKTLDTMGKLITVLINWFMISINYSKFNITRTIKYDDNADIAKTP